MSAPVVDPGLVARLLRLERVAAVLEGAVVLVGDVLERLRALPDASVHCIVTSPPYLDARDYGVAATSWPAVTYRPRFDLDPVTVPAMVCCLGHETTLVAYVAHLVAVWRELRRVLRPDGVCWLNLGAGYSAGTTTRRKPTTTEGPAVPSSWKGRCHEARNTAGLAAKQMILSPWAALEALQGDGWYVRNVVPWVKPNAKPDSATDRCTPSWEPIFLLTRGPKYFFDAHAISTPAKGASRNRARKFGADRADPGDHHGASIPWDGLLAHPRDVWTIPVGRFRGAHFATFPEELARRCVASGTSAVGCCAVCGAQWRKILTPSEAVSAGGGRRKNASVYKFQGVNGAMATGKYHARMHVGWGRVCRCPHTRPQPAVVLDPFVGSGTTLGTAVALDRIAVGVEAQPDFVAMMPERIAQVRARILAAPPCPRGAKPAPSAKRSPPAPDPRALDAISPLKLAVINNGPLFAPRAAFEGANAP